MMKTFLLIALISFSACSKRDKNSPDKNELNLALTSAVSTLDPAISYDTVSAKIVSQVYESLYEYDYLIRPYQLKPLLADDLPVIENDGLQYTIKLKKNIQYHDSPAFKGKKRFVIAQDFVNQIKRHAFRGTRSSGWWLFENKIIGLDEFRKKVKSDFSDFYDLKVPGLIAKDDHTLVIKLKTKYPQLIYALAMAFTTPVSKEIIDYYKNDLGHEAIGTGPYQFIKWNKKLDIKLKRNTNYHQSNYPTNGDRYSYKKNLLLDRGKVLPFIDNINFYIIKEAQTRWLKFLNKEIDIIILTKDHFSIALDPSGHLNKKFLKNKVELQISPTLTYWWLSFNMTDKFIGKNLNFRKAIAHALNIDYFIEKFTNNIALRANSIYPPGVHGYSPSNVLPYEYNVEKAKKFLAAAGFPNGKGLKEFNYDLRSSSTVSRQMGEFVQKELAKIGIKINIVLNTFPAFLNKARTGQLEIWQGGWAMDYPDPENVIQLLTTKNHAPGPNSSLYSNKKVDRLYKDLAKVSDSEEVLEITNQVQKQVTDDIPWVMQYYSRNYILFHGHVKNFRQSDLISNNLKYLRVK